MPSQPVQSLDSELRVWKSPRHFRRLGGASESLSLDLGVSRYSPGAFLAPVSPGCFPISVWRGGDWFALGQRLVRRGHTCRLRANSASNLQSDALLLHGPRIRQRRIRPILMTTMAALLGGVPLMLGTGTGSEIRQPLGYTIVGGLIVSQALTLFTTPVVYIYLDRLQAWMF